PFGEVRIMPEIPLAVPPATTNCVPVQTIFRRVQVASSDEVRWVQVLPSGEVRIMPRPPTVTHTPFPDVAEYNACPVPVVRTIQFTPSKEVWSAPEPPVATNWLPATSRPMTEFITATC